MAVSEIIKIKESCIGCGMCENVCPRHLFTVKDKAECSANDSNCFRCYQCFAACPVKAISVQGEEDSIEYSKESMEVDSKKLLNLMGYRRSTRAYKKEQISKEDMKLILDAAKAAPKGKNRPLFRFIVVGDRMEEVKVKLMEELSTVASNSDASNPIIGSELVRQNMINIIKRYRETGKDGLTFNAPNMIVLACDKKCGGRPMIDAGITGAYMELMANTLGIGCCFLGFAMTAIENSQAARDAIGLKENETVGAIIVLGYPKYKYLRTAPRKDTPITTL